MHNIDYFVYLQAIINHPKQIIMNFRLIIASCFVGLAMSAMAGSRDVIILIDGHFFSEMPVSSTEITGFRRISTADGSAKAMLITLANPLPESAFKFEVSAADIPQAEELLKRAESVNVRSLAVASSSSSKIAVGDKFPSFKATDISGKTWSNADVKGKAMVLNLWFTGCGPCRAEMPELSQWKDEMPDVMFFSATYEDAATARPVLNKQGFNWIPIVNDTQFTEWIDDSGYPLTVVVDKQGVITHIEHGTSPVQREQLKQQIASVR
jgi:thiol-disulfide isomerase/thioredoxin